MSIVKGTEQIVNPLQRSALRKKGLCDYVINVASGCLHGCTFCLAPETLILYSDLVWRKLEHARVGDELLGFDENVTSHVYRFFRKTTIEAIQWSKKPAYKIVTEVGEVIATQNHGWLNYRGQWLPTSRLTSFLKNRKDGSSTLQSIEVAKLGKVRGEALKGLKLAKVIDKIPLGVVDVVDIQTSTHTFFANGLATHNCYVPSTPAIRTKQGQLKDKGVNNPQMDWGKYLFVREEIPEKLAKILERKRTWVETEAGRGVVLLCSGTDPYQNQETARITRKIVEILTNHKKKVRILTRGLSWVKDLDVLKRDNVIVGMSLPNLDDRLSSQIEPQAPPPTKRYQALLKGYKAGCRLYIAMAPTPPTMTKDDLKAHLEKICQLSPEVIFWEPINARGSNGKRMIAAGLDFTREVMTKKSWAESFVKQWEDMETAAQELGILDKLHIWPDPELKGYVDEAKLESWFYKPTVEKW